MGDFILMTSVSPVDCSVSPTEGETAVGKQCILLFLSVLIDWGSPSVCHCIRHFPTSQTTHDLWMSVNKYYGTDDHSESCPLPLGRLGSLGCCNFMICTYRRTLVLCISRTVTGKPLCDSRSCSTQQINNWPFFLLTCIPQEALPFGVCSWLFISSHFFL